jgi:fucose 4-O-acetylase-like acetyltransferase
LARERDVRLDVLKALAIMLVILGHSITFVYGRATAAPPWLAGVFSVVSAANVPLFMFVAGYLVRPKADLRWLGGRAVRLIVPFTAWSVLVWVWAYRAQPFVPWMANLFVQPYVNGLWFLYVLFELCVIWFLLGRSDWLLLAAILASLLIEPRAVRDYGVGLLASQLPIFIAGAWFARRKFEPKAWVLAVAAALMVAIWTVPGFSTIYAVPPWYVAVSAALHTTSLGLYNPVLVFVRVLRIAVELSLVASCFWMVQKVRHGAWLGAITLGMYASHQFFFPAQFRLTAHVMNVIIVFVVIVSGAAGTALLLEHWQATRFLLLGWGKLPDWVTDRLPKKATEPG